MGRFSQEVLVYGNELLTVGLKNVVKRWFKIKRSKLKTRFLARRIKCPMNIKPLQGICKYTTKFTTHF
jgi:polyphosphate kinase 2 (PPK2 family)